MPAHTVAFRPAVPPDVAAITSLVQRAYRGESSRAGWTTEADLLDGQRVDGAEVQAKVASSAGEVLVGIASEDGGDDGGRIVACCELEHRGDAAYFGMFAVEPTRQDSGVGRRLLAFAEERAAQRWGVSRMEMTVIEQRGELIDWYGRRGYRPTGEQRPFPYGDPSKGLPLRPDLVFAVLAKQL